MSFAKDMGCFVDEIDHFSSRVFSIHLMEKVSKHYSRFSLGKLWCVTHSCDLMVQVLEGSYNF